MFNSDNQENSIDAFMKMPRSWMRFQVLFLSALIVFSTGRAYGATKFITGTSIIYFAKGSSEISEAGKKSIKELSKRLKDWDVAQILVEGYCENSPEELENLYSDNQELSQTRADKVLRLLQKDTDLPQEKFESIGRGVIEPALQDAARKDRAINRRVDIIIFREEDGDPTDLKASVPDDKYQVPSPISLSFRDIPIVEAFEMLSKKEQVNIVIEKGVSGNVSLNLYDVTLGEAITAMAEAGGYGIAHRHGGYVILSQKPDESITKKPETILRSFELQYAAPDKVKEILSQYMTDIGKATALPERKIIIVEDTAESLSRLEGILAKLDKQPHQILIEAKILEITLFDGEKFGLDWSKLFKGWVGDTNNTNISLGTSGLINATSGFLFNLTSSEISVGLNALKERGRVMALSTPKLLTIENQEASVIIGDRQGYKVTTTIDQVTTESIQFLESGVILRVTPSVDAKGRILMSIHPEVSTGTISGGIPSQTTTEVISELFTNDGQPIFIGGLIRNSTEYTRNGIPLLSDIPLLGNLFANIDEKTISTETIVLITPHIVNETGDKLVLEETKKMNDAENTIKKEKVWTRKFMEK